jgi:hypothetical protein
MGGEQDIYILLTDTGTVLTRLIKWYTGDPMNHASLVFDSGLTEVYSFGRRVQSNPFTGGFVKEDLNGEIFGSASCALYRCRVSREGYERMRLRVEEMRSRRDEYRYNFLGLFGVMLKFKLERRDAYFCSQFVAAVLKESGIDVTGKPPELVTPGDLASSPKLELVYRGHLTQLLGRWRRSTRLQQGA